mgnify:CR=1 FL=1
MIKEPLGYSGTESTRIRERIQRVRLALRVDPPTVTQSEDHSTPWCPKALQKESGDPKIKYIDLQNSLSCAAVAPAPENSGKLGMGTGAGPAGGAWERGREAQGL